MKKVRSQKSEVRSLEIYNVLGEQVYSRSNSKPQTSDEIDLSGNSEGVYFVKVITDRMVIRKVIIE
ncbi:MAG: T9SS type A sorting domain-containing protein [Nitrospirae bacterium]|nr:T9SS type A sorting domain-containing protein [Nitrospirota bacterium]